MSDLPPRVKQFMVFWGEKVRKGEVSSLDGAEILALISYENWLEQNDTPHALAIDRVLSSKDLWARAAALAPRGMLERFCESIANMYVIFTVEFERRFPKEFTEWNKRFHGE